MLIQTSRSRDGHGIIPRWPFAIDRSHPLATGLIGAYFTVPGMVGMQDLFGRRQPTTDTSSGDVTTGIISAIGAECVEFSGDNTNDRVDLGSVTSSDPLSLAGLTRASILSWARCDNPSTSTGFPRIIDKSDGGNAQNGWMFYTAQNSGIARPFFRTGAANTDHFAASAGLSAGQVGLLGYSMSSLSAGQMYVNGAAVSTTSQVLGAFPTGTTNAAIGNWNHTTGRMWDGAIYNVLVYQRTLSPDEHALAYHPETRWAWVQEYGRKSYFIPAAAPGGGNPFGYRPLLSMGVGA